MIIFVIYYCCVKWWRSVGEFLHDCIVAKKIEEFWLQNQVVFLVFLLCQSFDYLRKSRQSHCSI